MCQCLSEWAELLISSVSTTWIWFQHNSQASDPPQQVNVSLVVCFHNNETDTHVITSGVIYNTVSIIHLKKLGICLPLHHLKHQILPTESVRSQYHPFHNLHKVFLKDYF